MADKQVSQLPRIGSLGEESLFVVEHNGIAYNATSKQVNADLQAQQNALQQTVKDIRFEVSDPIEGGTNRYVTLTLTVCGNAYTGVVMIDGNVDVSGQLSAEALYATLGDIARLKVDSLSTSRRIPMYLKRDKSDDNYIDISEQHITLRRAWTDGSTEQARDDFGAKLYWEQDIEDAVLGADGYPYVDGARVFVTTEITDWPVMVYSYDSGDRWKVFFDEDNNYGPRMVWGEGDGTSSGKGRGYIEKPGLSFNIYNLGTDGVKRGVFMGNEFTDIVGQRRPTKIAFSGDVCNITLEGGITEKLTFNRTNGVITSVTDSNGHTCMLEGLE